MGGIHNPISNFPMNQESLGLSQGMTPIGQSVEMALKMNLNKGGQLTGMELGRKKDNDFKETMPEINKKQSNIPKFNENDIEPHFQYSYQFEVLKEKLNEMGINKTNNEIRQSLENYNGDVNLAADSLFGY